MGGARSSFQFCLSRDLSRLIEFAATNRSGNAPSFTSGWERRALWHHPRPPHVFHRLSRQKKKKRGGEQKKDDVLRLRVVAAEMVCSHVDDCA